MPYNKDGKSAPSLPYFRDFEFSNINMCAANTNQPLITVNGFSDLKHYTRNILFKDIKLPENAVVQIRYCDSLKFVNVKSALGEKPDFKISNSFNLLNVN